MTAKVRVREGFTMEALDVTRRCPKCGHDEIGVLYHPDLHQAGCNAECGFSRGDEGCQTFEHFDRHCRRCHYAWIEGLPEQQPVGARQPTDETGEAEVHINRLRFVVAPGDYSGAQVRRFMHPPLTDEHDLYVKGQNEDKQLDDDDHVVVRDGVEFYSAPKVINAGAA